MSNTSPIYTTAQPRKAGKEPTGGRQQAEKQLRKAPTATGTIRWKESVKNPLIKQDIGQFTYRSRNSSHTFKPLTM